MTNTFSAALGSTARFRGLRRRLILTHAIAGAFLAAAPMQAIAAAAPETATSPAGMVVDRSPVAGPEELTRKSELIIYGSIEGRSETHVTGNTEQGLRVVHSVQQVKVKSVLKGRTGANIRLLTSGVEPLPDADSPLNRTYTGPISEDEYLLFLRRADGSSSLKPYYTLTGIWQGLYPVYEGRTVALTDSGGFAGLGNISVAEAKRRIETWSR